MKGADLTGRHINRNSVDDEPNKDTMLVNENGDAGKGPRMLPFPYHHLESEDVPFMGRRNEILMLRRTCIELLDGNQKLASKNTELKNQVNVLRRKLGDAMAENAKLEGIIGAMRNDLNEFGVMDPVIAVRKLRAEQKSIEESNAKRRASLNAEHKALMERLESEYASRKAKLESELAELELVIDAERDKLAANGDGEIVNPFLNK